MANTTNNLYVKSLGSAHDYAQFQESAGVLAHNIHKIVTDSGEGKSSSFFSDAQYGPAMVVGLDPNEENSNELTSKLDNIVSDHKEQKTV